MAPPSWTLVVSKVVVRLLLVVLPFSDHVAVEAFVLVPPIVVVHSPSASRSNPPAPGSHQRRIGGSSCCCSVHAATTENHARVVKTTSVAAGDKPSLLLFGAPPPPKEVTRLVLQQKKNRKRGRKGGGQEKEEIGSIINPVAVSAVGRLASVRRMAKTLCFCELTPPLTNCSWTWTLDVNDSNHKNSIMTVLLLFVGSPSSSLILEDLQGKLVLVRGVTHVDNDESLKNWVKKNQLDVKVTSIKPVAAVVDEDDDSSVLWTPLRNPNIEKYVLATTTTTSEQQQHASSSSLQFLRLGDLYYHPPRNDDDDDDDEKNNMITVVDSLESVRYFHRRVLHLLTSSSSSSSSRTATTTTLVGIDCEWKPDMLIKMVKEEKKGRVQSTSSSAEDSQQQQPQPILVLQVCLHELQQVFLLDLQTLLRPLIVSSPSSSSSDEKEEEPPINSLMNEVEEAVAAAIRDLFRSPRALKVGFQLVGDLRRLAASYPHMMEAAFGRVEGVVEVSRLSRKVMRIRKQRNGRFVSSSLARLVEHHLQRSVDKLQQCSDWSQRPLTHAQLEYAAVDAAIGPVLLERHLLTNKTNVQIRTTIDEVESSPSSLSPSPQIGRWKDDVSFAESITSWEFVAATSQTCGVVPPAAAITTTTRRRSVKHHLRGENYSNYKSKFGNLPPVVTHRWITGTR